MVFKRPIIKVCIVQLFLLILSTFKKNKEKKDHIQNNISITIVSVHLIFFLIPGFFQLSKMIFQVLL